MRRRGPDQTSALQLTTVKLVIVGFAILELSPAFAGVAASTGSACHAGRIELSSVLQAMDVPPGIGMGAMRFSLGRHTTAGEIDAVSERLWRLLAPAG